MLLQDGGLNLLQITDNGHGINPIDFPLLCERFATSKLNKYNDLFTISTFGFRGEALASLTHVANVNVTSMTNHQQFAYTADFLDGKVQVICIDVFMYNYKCRLLYCTLLFYSIIILFVAVWFVFILLINAIR